jgi:hypothetical protein
METTENLSLVYLFNPHNQACDSGHVKFSYNLYITITLTHINEDSDINKEVIHS